MAHTILSLDVREDLLCGLVVEQNPADLLVRACGAVKVDGPDRFSAALSELLTELDVVVDGCVIGLPLSTVSLRNLTLPFTDRKKMAQVLPLELEEQLLVPIDRQVVDFIITGKNDTGSQVLVAAVAKEILAPLLSSFADSGQPVKIVAVSLELLVREYMTGAGRQKEATLFLHGEPHAMDIALWAGDKVVFMRRIAYPEFIFGPPLDGNGEIGLAVDRPIAEQYMHAACGRLKSSLYYVAREQQHEAVAPQQIVLSGCLADMGCWHSFMEREFSLPVTTVDQENDLPALRLSEDVQGKWNHRLYDTALILARTCLQGKKNQPDLGFLKGEFAPGAIQIFSRRFLTAAALVIGLIFFSGLGLLWLNYRSLESRAAELHRQMVAIYKQTFPKATRVKQPYLQMQSRLRAVQGSEVSLPLFSGEQRALTLLADISSRIPRDISLHVSRLVIDQDGVQVKGVTDAFNNVDVIKNRLAASPRYGEVTIVSAAADKKKGKIRFEIHLLLGEAS